MLAGTRSSILFLQEGGLTPVQAQRVVNQHGVDTEPVIRADPYKAMLGGAVTFKYGPASASSVHAPELCTGPLLVRSETAAVI